MQRGMMARRIAHAAAGSLALVTLCAASVFAQSTGSAPTAGGPMTVEVVRNGWAIAPDVKITRFDDGTHALAGAYGGIVFDRQLLIGAAGYWLTDPSHSRKLGYGGALVEWRERIDRPIGFSVKGLLGFGSATVSRDVTVVPLPVPLHNATSPTTTPLAPTTINAAFREDFFVAEPEADVLVRITSHVRLHVGAGYRAVGGADRVGSEIRGATGAVSLEIGPSSRP
jgi:hypothetical protein